MKTQGPEFCNAIACVAAYMFPRLLHGNEVLHCEIDSRPWHIAMQIPLPETDEEPVQSAA